MNTCPHGGRFDITSSQANPSSRSEHETAVDLLDEGVGSLAKSLPNLEILEVNRLPHITLDCLAALGNLNKLSMLFVQDCLLITPLSHPSAVNVNALVLGLRPNLRAAIATADTFELSYFAI